MRWKVRLPGGRGRHCREVARALDEHKLKQAKGLVYLNGVNLADAVTVICDMRYLY